MLLVFNDPFGTPIALGSGYIFSPDKNNPIKEHIFDNGIRLTFMLTTSIKRAYDLKLNNPDKYVLQYESCACELYISENNKNMYALLKEAKTYERVEFMGRLIRKTQKLESGEETTTQVIRLESLSFPDRVAAMLLGREITRADLEADAYTEAGGIEPPKDDDYTF
ncbi:MAG: hypothetical protein KBS59_00245 [Clostridiales bacterium]|nr:hypothetical protein [Clostridiales bacterium]